MPAALISNCVRNWRFLSPSPFQVPKGFFNWIIAVWGASEFFEKTTQLTIALFIIKRKPEYSLQKSLQEDVGLVNPGNGLEIQIYYMRKISILHFVIICLTLMANSWVGLGPALRRAGRGMQAKMVDCMSDCTPSSIQPHWTLFRSKWSCII